MATNSKSPNGKSPGPSSSSAQEVFDGDGKLIGLVIDGVFHPINGTLSVPGNGPSYQAELETEEGITNQVYRAAALALMKDQKDKSQERYDRHKQKKAELDRDYAGEPLGGIRRGVAKFQASLSYHQERRDADIANRETWDTFDQKRAGHILNIVDVYAQDVEWGLTSDLEARKRKVAQEVALFEDDRLHRDADANRAQELEIKKLELDSAERTAMMEVAKQLPDILEELRWMEKEHPTDQVKEAAKVVEAALLAFGGMGVAMTKEDRDTIAPVLREALREGMKAIRRSTK